MSYTSICQAVSRIKKKTRETDIRKLCRAMGILISPADLGTGPDCIKGFFLRNNRIPVITVNCRLPEVVQRFVLAHELGHAVLHSKGELRYFHEGRLFTDPSPMEKEANLFAAELLAEDRDVLALIGSGTDFFTAAARLNIPPELLEFKLRLMRWKGCEITEPPIHADSTFLKHADYPPEAGD